MTEFNRTIGEAIKAARRGMDVTQEALADAVGLSRTSVVNIEAGQQGLTLENFVRIAYALDVPYTDLLPGATGASVAVLHRQIRALEARLAKIRALAGRQ